MLRRYKMYKRVVFLFLLLGSVINVNLDPLAQNNTKIIRRVSSDDSFNPTYYAGRGINLLTSTDFSTNNFAYYKIFNNQIEEIYYNNSASDNEQKTSVQTSNSFQEISENITKEYCFSLGAEMSMGAFSGGIQSKFGFTDSLSSSYYFNAYYLYKKYYTIRAIEGFETPYKINLFTNYYLSTAFKNRIESLLYCPTAYLDNEIDRLFYDFGTHVILNNTLGGRIEIGYHFFSNKYMISNLSKAEANLKTYFNGQTNGVDIKAKSETIMSGSITEINSEGHTYSDYSISAVGGNYSIYSSGLPSEETVVNWYNTINQSNYAFVNVHDEHGIKPIWAYVSNTRLKESIEERYETLQNEKLSSIYPNSYSMHLYRKEDTSFGGGNNRYIKSYQLFDLATIEKAGYNKICVGYSCYVWKHVGAAQKKFYIYMKYGSKDIIASSFEEGSSKAFKREESNEMNIGSLLQEQDNPSKDFTYIFDASGNSKTHSFSKLNIDITFTK